LKKKILALFMTISLLGIAANIFAQEEDTETEEIKGKHYAVNLSLYYPISLNQTKNDSVNLNLGLLYSHVGYISGFDLSGLASVVSHRMEGVQLSGLFAVAGESGQGVQTAGLVCAAGDNFSGLQVSGLFNVAGTSLSGFQTAGLINVAGEHGRWFQAAGLANVAGETYSGIQAGGLFNVIGEQGSGFQASGLFNVVGEDFTGFQASGLFNVVGEDFTGFQLGPINVAVHSKGVQVGVVNLGEVSDGLQIGVVNYSKKENNGIPFGLVNLARNGFVRGIAWGGNAVATSAGVKFTVRNLYSIISLGLFNLNDKINESLTYGFHYGISFPVGDLDLNTDVGYRFRDNKSLFKHSHLTPDQHILEARLFMGIPLSPKLSLLLGGGLSRIFDSGKHWDSGRTSPLVIAGFEFF